MKYIQKFDNFKPIKINNEKPFKIKKDILKSIIYLQKGIKSDTKRIQKEKSISKKNKLTQDRNSKMQKLKQLMLHNAKQIKYLKDNPIEESKENNKTLLKILESESFKADDIINYIGFDEDDYKIESEYNYHKHEDVPSIYNEGIDILIKPDVLEDAMGIDEGILSWFLSFGSYGNNYEYYVDEEELNYLNNYLTDEILNKIKKLSIIFNSNIDPNKEGEICELFYNLGLKSHLDDFKNEISYENERAVEKAVKETIDSLPYGIDNIYDKNGFNITLNFEYKDIIKYIKENKIEEVETLKEFIENVSENSDFNYEIEYNNYEYLDDFKDLRNEVENITDAYLDNPDEVIPKIIQEDNLEMFKKNIEHALFSYEYTIFMDFKREKLNLFELIKRVNGKILKWIKTDEFKNIIEKIGGSDLEAYRELMFGEDVNAFNL